MVSGQASVQSEDVGQALRPRALALRCGLPFGVVMATAGASVLAGRCGAHALAKPLLALAFLQAVWLPLAGAWRRRAEFHLGWRAWWMIGPHHEHAGIHTIPLGLAVCVDGLLALVAPAQARWAWPLACVCLELAWCLAIVFATRFVLALGKHGLRLGSLDGAWFLVPAAFLGVAVATDAMAGHINGADASILAGAALGGALVGWIGYWIVVFAALVRVRRFGLGGVAQAPWWIAMGCAGLAAAALGCVVQGPGSGGALRAFLTGAMVATEVLAILLGAAVLVGSGVFLLRRCRFRARAAWPPTFSTAVFALGALVTGAVLSSPAFLGLGLAAAWAVLVFWGVTMAWNLGYALFTRR